MSEFPQISVIIVNYNSGNFIVLALESLSRAIEKVPAEILVVDNASTDNSVTRIRSIFPDVTVIENSKNVGFAAANNIGLRQARGEYILLINPDTVVPEDIFPCLINFMHETPDAGAVGVKILNADGSFSVDSRHSVPSPLTAFWKQIGFDRLFPGSRIFGQYNLTYLDPDETYPVDAISGSFIFLRRQAIQQVGLLDEKFFMYCEDLDYCYRLTREEWKVYYYSGISILHYKGESTSKHTLHYSFIFNRSLFLYYRKHFHFKFGYLMHILILSGVILRGVLSYVKHQIRRFVFRIIERLQRSSTKEKRVIWIGTSEPGEKKREIILSAGYRITGLITGMELRDNHSVQGIPLVGNFHKLTELHTPPGTAGWIFDTGQISFKFMLETISHLSAKKLNFMIYSSRIQAIISKKSNI